VLVAAVLWFVLVTTAIIAALVLAPIGVRGPGPGPGARTDRKLDLYESAFLAGGARRVFEAVLLKMQREGRLHVSSDGVVTVAAGMTHQDPVEKDLLAASRLTYRNTVRDMRKEMVDNSTAVREVGAALARDALVLPIPNRPLRAAQALALTVLVAGCATVPIPYAAFDSGLLAGVLLAVCLSMTGLLAYLARAGTASHTGEQRLADLRTGWFREGRSTSDSIAVAALGVALLGLSMIEGDPLYPLLHGGPAAGASGSASGGTSHSGCGGGDGGPGGGGDGGGDGCGGGGCGGCGGG
jgi:uncharacterized protein (TIGR04222 family)